MQNSKLQFKIQNLRNTKYYILNTIYSCQRQVGFTLIELIIVLAIIGIVSGLSLTNLTSVIQKSRDGQRKADLRQIQAGLELYRADQTSYPESTGGNAFTAACESQLKAGTSPNEKIYIQSVPCDPSGADYTYDKNAAAGYSLIACLERDNDPDIDKDPTTGEKVPCTGTTRWQYTLENP